MKALWAGYFEWLYQADPLAVELDIRNITVPIADLPINCEPPLFVESQATVHWLKWDKPPGICGIHAELLKAGGNAALVSLMEASSDKIESCKFPDCRVVRIFLLHCVYCLLVN